MGSDQGYFLLYGWPLVLSEDFNDIAVAKEKFGGRNPSCARISAFNDFLNDCALIDLGFKGHPFTWRNNRVGSDAMMECLDKAYANIEGRGAFPQAMVFHDSAIGSDHCPIRLNLEEPLKIYRPFRFESMWTVEEDCEGIVKANWASEGGNSNISRVVQKLVRCKRDLQAWHKGKFSKMKDQIATLKCKIEAIQGGHYSLASKIEEEDLTAKLNKLWEQEEMYWHQRSRLNYLKFGDRHSRFFHITATQRRQRNLILRLKNDKEEWINSPRVSDLLLDGGRLWDEEKIDSLFPWEVGIAIKSTPISWSGGEDKLTWQKPNAKVTLKRALGFHGEFLAATCSQINVPALRDDNGSVVEINHGRIRVSSALAAEAWAIRIAVSMALAGGKKDAMIESDCQPLVNMLQPKSVLKNWTIQAFLDDIFSFSANSNFVFSWCNRQANRCANWIACNSRLGVGFPLAPCNLPDELRSLIRLDL
ncbi:hypothetical protein RHGRI_018630 [Rhododendron griersonianum]|uniref:RNase H type-1 domain-containing protein n=1 Tax=Rhododendron griersonianum TaxID=479676 RepID=A0AAV6K2A1_9ERIC|nr:hypothetical protein RHGRI_018630 [Rhododendron griersonianum]